MHIVIAVIYFAAVFAIAAALGWLGAKEAKFGGRLVPGIFIGSSVFIVLGSLTLWLQSG
jgi:hypothetical protein